MKAKPAMHRVRQEPDENQIRDYARHLYEQSGCVPGRDLENWLEAERTLTAALQPSVQTRRRRDMSVSDRAIVDTSAETHSLAK